MAASSRRGPDRPASHGKFVALGPVRAYSPGVAPWEKAVLATEVCLAAAVLAGLIVRGHWRSCYAFCLYLVAFGIFEGAILAFPARFFRLDFWLAKEAVEALLKLAVAFEIAARIFWRLPTARTIFTLTFLICLLAIAGAVAPTVGADLDVVASVGLPRLLYGTALIFAGLLAVCLWFHVPLYPIHKAILVGFVPYLVAFTMVLQILQTFGWDVRGAANYLNTIAFIALLGFWTRAAWRRVSVSEAPPSVVSFLQPWVRPGRA